MTRQFKNPLKIALLAMLAQGASHASSESGFFYDAKGDRYFSDGKSSFSIRPIRDKNYVERIEVSIDDGSFQSYTGKLNFSSEGLHNIRFRAVDPVHNWSPMQHFRVFVDMTPPKSRPFWQGAQFSKDGVLYVAPDSELLINSQDTLSGVARVVWKNDDKTVHFPGKLKFNKTGEHKLKFASVDNVGNTEGWYEVTFFVDGKAPDTKLSVQGTSFNSKEGLFVSSGSEIVLTAADDKSGVKAIEYKINNGPTTEYQHPIAISDNRFELKYRSVDNVGNNENWNTFTVLQDSTPPRLQLSMLGSYQSIAGKLYAKPGFSFKASADDSESGMEKFLVSLDGKDFTPAKSNQFGFRKAGTYYFEVNARDKVGNLTASNPYTVVIDEDPPKSTLSATDALVKKGEVLLSAIPNKLHIKAEDDGVGIDRIEISYDGKTFSEYKNEIDLSAWSSDQRTLFYRAVDRLGNIETANQVAIHVRKTAPSVELYVENGNQPEVPLSALQNSSARQPATRSGSRRSASPRARGASPRAKAKGISKKSSKRSGKSSKRKKGKR